MGELMLWLSGVDRNVLSHCERERNKFIAMGGTVLTTATLACVSATFTVAKFLHVPIFFALVLGLAWGFAIMNLDRWLLISIRRQSTARRTLLMGVPRIILAFLIGAVIAHPLLLEIFNKEIKNQAATEKAEALEDAEGQTRERFAAIPALETKIQGIHAELGSLANGTAVTESPEYVEAVEELHRLEHRQASAQRDALCEAQGRKSCGTGVIGEGPAFEAKNEVSESLREDVEAKGAEVAAIRARLHRGEANQAGTTRQVGNRRLARLESQRRNLVKKRDEQLEGLEKVRNEKIGILDRVAALDTLTVDRPELLTMELLIFFFILAIDTLPAVMKMLMALGEPSLYEEVQKDLEEADAVALREQTKAHAKASRIEAGILVDDATARRAAMKEAQDELVNQSVDAMREAGERFIALWRREILDRVPHQVREELRRTGMGEGEGEPGPGGGGNGHEPGRRPEPGSTR
jgi:hypothetical protein